MAGQEIAYLTAFVGADITSFRRAMGEVRSSLLDIGGLSENLRNTGRNLTYALTVPLLGAGATAVKFASDFDAAMRNVASISDVVANNFENSSAIVLEWGSSIRSGPVAAAEALNTVMQAGFGLNDFNEALTVAQVSAFTAEAGLADLTTTTEALVAALLSYSAGADQAAYYSDILTRMVQVGVGTMSEFGNSLAQVLPSAATLGVEFDELGGVMAYLTQRGFPASRAATSLANAFNKLITPSEEMNRVWQELGVTSGTQLIDTFGGVQGAFNALFEIAETSPDAARALAAMFPDERGRRAIQLAMTDVNAFNATMNEFMADVTGATARAHEQQMMSFAAQWDLFTAALQTAAITVGQHLLPILTPLVQTFTGFLSVLNDVNPAAIQLGIGIAGAVAAAGPLLWILGTIMTPVGLLTGAIVGLAGAFALNFGGIRTTIENFVNDIFPDFTRFQNLLDAFFNTLMGTSEIEGFWTQPNIENNYTSQWVEGTQRTFAERLEDAWSVLGPEIGSILNTAFNNAIQFAVDEGFPAIDGLGSSIINGISNLFGGTEDTYKGANSPIFQAFRSLFNGGIGEAVNNLSGWLNEHFPEITSSINEFFANFKNWLINEGVPTLGRILGYGIGTLGSLVADLIRGIFSGEGGESPVVRGFIDGFTGGLNQAFDDAGIKSALDRGVTLIAGVLGALFIGSIFVNGLSSSLVLAFNAVKFIGASVLMPLATTILTGIGTAIAAAGGITGLVSGVVGAIQNAAIWLYLYGIPAFTATATTIITGIGTAIAALPAGVAILGAALSGVIAGLIVFDLIPQDIRNQIAQSILDAIGSGFDNVDSSEYAAAVQRTLADPIARILDAVGIEHGLWQLMDQTQNELIQEQMGAIGDADSGFNPKTNPVARFLASLGPLFDTAIATTTTFKANYISLWIQLLNEQTANTQAATDDLGTASRKLQLHESKIKLDLIETTNTVGVEMQKMKNHFNVQQVTLPTDPFTNALHNLRNAIQPIIDGIVAAWNAMLALVGQQVTIPDPVTPGTGGGGTRGTTGGAALPAFATPGYLGAGQVGLIGDEGPELVRFGRPTSLMPRNMYNGNSSSGGTQINNITIVTNDVDKFLSDLRRRGIDLELRTKA